MLKRRDIWQTGAHESGFNFTYILISNQYLLRFFFSLSTHLFYFIHFQQFATHNAISWRKTAKAHTFKFEWRIHKSLLIVKRKKSKFFFHKKKNFWIVERFAFVDCRAKNALKVAKRNRYKIQCATHSDTQWLNLFVCVLFVACCISNGHTAMAYFNRNRKSHF